MDTNVLVAAVRSRNGASNALLSAAAVGRYRMLVSVPLFLEYEAVLTRPEHLMVAQVTAPDMLGFLDHLAGIVEPVHIDYLWRPSLNDPADEMVLETAINGQADYIATSNLRHFEPAHRHGIKVAYPGSVLRSLP